jgi:hypothetical protein
MICKVFNDMQLRESLVFNRLLEFIKRLPIVD